MSERTARILLALLVVLAAALRAHGIRFGVPLWTEPDVFIVDHVNHVRSGTAELDPTLSGSQYPSLLADIALRLPGPEDDPARLAEMGLDEHLRNAALPFLQVRLLVAAISILVVPATYLVARAFLAPGWSVLAAAFAAGSLLLVNLGHVARPHGALTALITLSLAAALRLRHRPTPANHLLAGLAAALAMGCLHTGTLTLCAIASALLLPAASAARWRGATTLLPLLLPPLAALWFYRGIYDPAASVRLEDHEPITFAWWLNELWYHFNGKGLWRVGKILYAWEPVLGALTLLALGLTLTELLRGRRPDRARLADLLVVAAFALPYGFLLAAFGKTYERFLTPLIPLLACAAAWLWSRAWAHAGAARALVLALSLGTLLASSLPGAKLALLHGRLDTLQEATRLVAELARPGDAIVLSPPIDLRMARTPAALDTAGEKRLPLFSPWTSYQAALPPGGVRGEQYDLSWFGVREDMGDLDQDDALAAYVDYYGPGLFVFDLERLRKHHWYVRIRDRVAQLGTLEARLSPDPDPNFTDLGLGVQDRDFPDQPHAVWRILRARAWGPVLEIYRVEPLQDR